MKKTNYGKMNYGTIVMVIGLMMCIGCSQVSFNNPFGESEPTRTNVDTADNTADNAGSQASSTTTTIKYVIRFNSNGGSSSMADLTADGGQTIVLPTCTIVPPVGKKFNCWNGKSDGADGASYADGASVKNLADTDGEIVRLYAQWIDETAYRIIYLNAKNADNPNKTSFLETDTIVLQDVSADGFTFDGWYEVTDNIADTSTDGWAAGSKTADVTLWAKWTAINNDPTDPMDPAAPTAKVYTIKFDNNTGSGIMADITADVGVTITLPTCIFNAPTGKKFGSWNGKADGTAGINYADSASVKNLSETDGTIVTLYAQWIDKDAHRIVYQNTKNADNSLNPTSFKESESVILTNVSISGYTFDGWYDSSTDGNLITEWSAGAKTRDVTLWAKWRANRYQIIFDPNEGRGDIIVQDMTYDIEGALVKNRFKRTGYTFLGWSDNSSDVTARYNDGTIVLNLSAADEDTIFLFAIWKVNSYNIVFQGNDGTGMMRIQKMVYDVTADLRENNFIRTGYTFSGWARNPFQGKIYNDKQSVSKLASANNYDINLFAVWEPNTYTIKFNSNGGFGTMNDQIMIYGSAETLTENSFARAGYTFSGWGRYPQGFYNDNENVSNLTTVKDDTVTLNAVWKPNTYRIKFDSNGGWGTMNGQTMTYDISSALTANAFTRTGYTFLGWSNSSTSTSVIYTDKQYVINLSENNHEEITLYAIWEANTYTIVFNANGGSGSMSNLDMIYDTAKVLPENGFTRTYYTFKGWNTSADGSGISYINKESVKNLTAKNGGTVMLYAIWDGVWHIGIAGNFACGDTTYIYTAMKQVLKESTTILCDCVSGAFDRSRGTVTIEKYAIGKYEVTKQLFEAVMGYSSVTGSGVLPEYYVSWYGAILFCNRLSLLMNKTRCYKLSDGITYPDEDGYSDEDVIFFAPNSNKTEWDNMICDWTADGYRLPSECEWECAARGGIYSTGKPWTYIFSGSDDYNSVIVVAEIAEVGSKCPNNLGIYDMSGNVWEWCWDNFSGSLSVENMPVTGPNTNSSEYFDRMIRGGSSFGSLTYCQVSYRNSYSTPFAGSRTGFRIACISVE